MNKVIKYICIFMLGFGLKVFISETSNLYYQYQYMKLIWSAECSTHSISPHICANEILNKNDKVNRILIYLNTNPDIWECYSPMDDEKKKCKAFPRMKYGN